MPLSNVTPSMVRRSLDTPRRSGARPVVAWRGSTLSVLAHADAGALYGDAPNRRR
jgi:hypothetical protein